jgi:hypothetical protein
MADRQRRDQRRRRALIDQQKKPGRPPGMTAVRLHPKRFEAVIWLVFRKKLGFGYSDAGRLSYLLLRHRGPFELFDAGHGYALWRGDDPFTSHAAEPHACFYRDLKKVALELLKRSDQDAADRLWLQESIESLACAWSAARRNHREIAYLGLEGLIELGWPRDFLFRIAERLAGLPAQAVAASPRLAEAFERLARKHRLAVDSKFDG